MILSLEDFLDREYKIPNQNESRDLESWIERHEERILKQLLGYELWKEFTEALDSSTIEDKWTELRDGAEYEYNDKTYKYSGLVDLLRPAIFSLWVPVGTWKLTNSGFVSNNAPQQAVVIEQVDDFTSVGWNEFVAKCNGHCLNHDNTFYGFMQSRYEEDYPDWDFTEQTFKNRYGL